MQLSTANKGYPLCSRLQKGLPDVTGRCSRVKRPVPAGRRGAWEDMHSLLPRSREKSCRHHTAHMHTLSYTAWKCPQCLSRPKRMGNATCACVRSAPQTNGIRRMSASFTSCQTLSPLNITGMCPSREPCVNTHTHTHTYIHTHKHTPGSPAGTC